MTDIEEVVQEDVPGHDRGPEIGDVSDNTWRLIFIIYCFAFFHDMLVFVINLKS